MNQTPCGRPQHGQMTQCILRTGVHLRRNSDGRRDYTDGTELGTQRFAADVTCKCKGIGGDTECPLQFCQSSRSSASMYFLSLRCRSSIRFHQSPGWLLKSEARASDLFLNNPEYKTPTLSYETHPNDLNTDNYKPFEAAS